MRSDTIKKGPERAPHRGLLRAVGLQDGDFDKPFIAIANSYTDIIPGHVHLHEVGETVKDAVRAAGGVPFVFNTIGIDDGIAMGHGGMKYSLPSREIIADSVEAVVRAHCFDGLVAIPNCDKIVPGMLMAAMRLNIPTIFLSGGPMAAGRTPSGKVVDLIDIFAGVAMHRRGEIDDTGLLELERYGCPGCGSCSGLFTANSMNCLNEALGLSLPGTGTILATRPERQGLYREAGRRIMDLVRSDLKPLDIVTERSLDNAFVLDLAMGGSTNTVLHALAVAHEAGIDYSIDRVNDLSRRTPNICRVAPSSHYHVEDVDAAGGVSAILREVSRIDGLLHLNCPTVTGRTLGENIEGAAIRDPECIRPIERAYSPTGGISILRGSLAPGGAIVKTAGVRPEMMVHEGPAVIFDSQEDACEGILGGRIRPGDVVVIRYEGPKGGPGMQEMLAPTSYIKGMHLDDSVALVTDGRFSGGTSGACIGHVSPEAAERGPIALLQNGDRISIHIPKGRLDVKVPRQELSRRKREWTPPPPRVTHGYLGRYAALATNASTGGILKVPEVRRGRGARGASGKG